MTYSLSTRERRVSRLNRKGFTLIELIVVIAILAILAAIAIPSFTNVLDTSRQRADEASAKVMTSAIRVYQAQEATMPASTAVDTRAEFNSVFASVLPDGVPAIQHAGNIFALNTSTWIVTVRTALVGAEVNIT